MCIIMDANAHGQPLLRYHTEQHAQQAALGLCPRGSPRHWGKRGNSRDNPPTCRPCTWSPRKDALARGRCPLQRGGPQGALYLMALSMENCAHIVRHTSSECFTISLPSATPSPFPRVREPSRKLCRDGLGAELVERMMDVILRVHALTYPGGGQPQAQLHVSRGRY